MGRQKIIGSGWTDATEMNVGRSEAEWNPVSIVAWVCEKVCASLVLCFVGKEVCHAL